MESSLEKIQSIYNNELQVLRKEMEYKNKIINKTLETKENINNKAVQPNPLAIRQMIQMIRTDMREKRSKYQKTIIQVKIRNTPSKK